VETRVVMYLHWLKICFLGGQNYWFQFYSK
jgi:hypothetical protein